MGVVHTVAVSLRTVSATDGMPKVERIIVTSDRPSASGCTEPPAAERVLISDEQVFVWFLVSGVRGGDNAGVEWRQPDGRTYSSGRWNPFPDDGTWCLFTSMKIAGDRPSVKWIQPDGRVYFTYTWDPSEPGNRCFWAWIRVAGFAPAGLPGAWKAEVSWNGKKAADLAFGIAPLIPSERVFTKEPSSGSCTPPPPAASFRTTDAMAALWFRVERARAGDVLRTEWVAPDGSVVRRGQFTPIARDGNWCFRSTLPIANAPASEMPGTWTVRVLWENVPLFSASFEIEDDSQETEAAPPSMQGMSRTGAVSFAEESAPVLIDAAPPPPQTLTGMGAGAGSGGAAAEGARSRQLR